MLLVSVRVSIYLVPSSVSSMENGTPPRQPRTAKHGDGRRNLYVLGLPFDLTKCVSILLSSYNLCADGVLDPTSWKYFRDMVTSATP